jgi:hypothetical protein
MSARIWLNGRGALRIVPHRGRTFEPDSLRAIVFRLLEGTTGTGTVLYTSPSIRVGVVGPPS